MKVASRPVFIVPTSRHSSTELTRDLPATDLPAFLSVPPNAVSSVIARRLPTDTLYGNWEQASPTVRRAIELIDQAISLLRRATAELVNDPIASDDAMNKMLPVLTELFCCRQVGEGFATAVNALLCAVQNNASNRWQVNQLQVTLQEVTRLRNEPFLTFDTALQLIDHLEQVGLVPQPQAFDYLTDWLDGESVR